jgi:hypothetical protein
LQRLVERFPGHGIEIVSGYRPHARPGSRHRSGDALDLRIDDVDNFELSEFARTLEGTGIGYYPNSTFVHIDVRAAEAYWVDRSGPGEKADYGAWPRKQRAVAAADAEPADTPSDAIAPTEEVATETIAADGTDPVAEEAVAEEPVQPSTTEAQTVDDASDPELKALADRALVIMNLSEASSRDALPARDAP